MNRCFTSEEKPCIIIPHPKSTRNTLLRYMPMFVDEVHGSCKTRVKRKEISAKAGKETKHAYSVRILKVRQTPKAFRHLISVYLQFSKRKLSSSHQSQTKLCILQLYRALCVPMQTFSVSYCFLIIASLKTLDHEKKFLNTNEICT